MALKQALTPEFRLYQRQVVANCRVLAETLMELGYKVVTGTNKNLGGTHRPQAVTLLLVVAHSLTLWLAQSVCVCRLVAVALQLQVRHKSGSHPEEQVPSEMAFPGEGLAQRCRPPWSLGVHTVRMAQFFWQTVYFVIFAHMAALYASSRWSRKVGPGALYRRCLLSACCPLWGLQPPV